MARFPCRLLSDLSGADGGRHLRLGFPQVSLAGTASIFMLDRRRDGPNRVPSGWHGPRLFPCGSSRRFGFVELYFVARLSRLNPPVLLAEPQLAGLLLFAK